MNQVSDANSAANRISYSFRGQRPNELVSLVIRQHAWTLLPIVVTWLVVILICGLSLGWFGASTVTSVVVVIGVVIALIITGYNWYIWINGLYIITNQRVIRISQRSLFNRLISEAEIDRIQEISTEIAGPIKTMLNFGTVKLQTASTTARVDLKNVPDPYDIQQQIVRLQRQAGPTKSVLS